MAENRTITMSTKEIERSEILRIADERKITQKAGAKRIKIGARHFRRLLSDYRDGGAETLISGHRGKPSNNSMPIEKKEKILRKLKSDYQGFGPTLASEKLLERDG